MEQWSTVGPDTARRLYPPKPEGRRVKGSPDSWGRKRVTWWKLQPLGKPLTSVAQLPSSEFLLINAAVSRGQGKMLKQLIDPSPPGQRAIWIVVQRIKGKMSSTGINSKRNWGGGGNGGVCQRVHTSSYDMNKFRGCTVQRGDSS